MDKKIQHKELRGLPGGPNEMLTYTTGIFSTEGFRMDSPDVNNYQNIIPSGSISMKERDGSPLRKGPIHGVDNLGNAQVMYPGYNYQFPGTEVTETLMAQKGYEVPKRRGVRLNYDDKGNVVSESTHIMATETDGKGNWFSFPTLFQNSIPYADDSKNWVDMSDRPWEEAYEEAKKRNEVIEFGKDKEAAIKFGKGSWKPKMKLGGALLDKTIKCGNCGWEWKAADGGIDPLTCHKCGGKGLVKAQPGGEQKFVRPADLPILPSDAGTFNNWLYEKADKRQKKLQSQFDAERSLDKEAKYTVSANYADLLTAEFYGPNKTFNDLNDEDRSKISNIIQNRQKNLDTISLVSADLTNQNIKAGYDPNYHRMYLPPVPTERGVHSHEFSHVGDQAGFQDGVNPGVGTYFTEQLNKSVYSKESPEYLNQPSSLKKNKTIGQNVEEGYSEADYLQDPSEVKARLRALRDSSIQQGYKLLEPDYNINKYKEGFNKEEKKQYEQLKKSGLSDDKINEMMYLFANNDQAQLSVGKNGVEFIAQNGGEETSWSAYLNPANWGTYRYDEHTNFKDAFRTARNEGESDFLWHGTRYTTKLKEPAPVAPVKKPGGITPELLIRQAYRESRFNPNAISPAGYKGIGQIGSAVIKDYKKANNITGNIDPFNIKQNTDVQKYSMNELYNSSFINKPGQSEQVRLAKTLASYNWGRGNVIDLLTDLKKDGVDIYNSLDWINKLPDEPKNYINDILFRKNTTFNTDFSKALANQKNSKIKSIYGFQGGGEIKSGSLMESYNKLLEQKKMGGSVEYNKKQYGGQLNSNNMQLYKDYVKGAIDDNLEAIKNYDKLNRLYYTDAKELGMSVPNYIMTHLVGSS